MELSNVREKKGTTKCGKSTVKCEVGTTQYNVRKKKKRTTKCDKRIVTYDVGIAQCEDEIVKCNVLISWYSRLCTSGYCTPFKKGGTVELPRK